MKKGSPPVEPSEREKLLQRRSQAKDVRGRLHFKGEKIDTARSALRDLVDHPEISQGRIIDEVIELLDGRAAQIKMDISGVNDELEEIEAELESLED